MKMTKCNLVVSGLLSMTLIACGTPTHTTSASSASSIPVTSTSSSASGYGVIHSIEVVQRDQAGIGVGAVTGAVVGGVLGNQVGSGSGRKAATVVGAAGGALAGHQMEKNMRGTDQVYRINVRMDNGAFQTLVQETPAGLQVGERVRLANGVIVERYR